MKRLTDFEAKRESVFAYAFSTLGSCQEQIFRLMSEQFAVYKLESHPEVPQIPILENYDSRTFPENEEVIRSR